MVNNINEVINNSLGIDKSRLIDNIKLLVNQMKDAIDINKDNIIEANNIDLKNNNGFKIDFDVINNILSNVLKENIVYGDVTLSLKDDNKKMIYGKQIMDIGNVVVVTDGNPYTLIEMFLRNFIVGNAIIFTNEGYMFGVNNLFINIFQGVLEKNDINRSLVQICVTEELDKLLNNFANIDLVIGVGNRELQNKVLKLSRNKTIVSGYENFDIYVDDSTHLDFLNKVMQTGLEFNIYINENLRVTHEQAMMVSDIDEAISQINYTGSRYSSAIFTNSKENATKFIREVKSSIVTINTSPTIERLIDIRQSDLYNEKTIIYPSANNTTDDGIEIYL